MVMFCVSGGRRGREGHPSAAVCLWSEDNLYEFLVSVRHFPCILTLSHYVGTTDGIQVTTLAGQVSSNVSTIENQLGETRALREPWVWSPVLQNTTKTVSKAMSNTEFQSENKVKWTHRRVQEFPEIIMASKKRKKKKKKEKKKVPHSLLAIKAMWINDEGSELGREQSNRKLC